MPLLSDAIIDIMIQMGIVVLLCIGFTFTYQIEGFPNFAHICFALIGTTITFSMTKLMGYNPYLSLPFSALFCGVLGMFFYSTMVRVIKRRRDGGIALTIAFYALSIVLETMVGIYSYWIVLSRHETTRGFALRMYDFRLFGFPGVAIVASLSCIFLVGLLYYALTSTRFGVSLRAVAEDEDLSAVYGINTLHVHLASWFIVGALAGIAGSFIPLWTSVRGSLSQELLITVMAGSIIGGLDSIYGSILGGVLITLFQRGLTYVLMNLEAGGEPLLVKFSLLLRGFEQLIPIIFIFSILMVMPKGMVNTLRIIKARIISD
jgi:branched-chain amino acid transport system permease protein